jgi:hypothetical protein
VSFDLDELPTFEGARRFGRGRGIDSPVADAFQPPPDPISGAITRLGIERTLELAGRLQQGVFPTASEISQLEGDADGPSYSMYLDCGGYQYGATCSEACFGFAPHHMDPYYCATCDEQAADPTNNPSYNWHYVGSRGSIQYWDREPDVCNGRDAWKWEFKEPCGNCATSAVFRCHDGYKLYSGASSPDPTICQGIVACDGNLTTC